MVDRKIVAIHQPNFFPWLGFFDKIKRADIFVYLDDAQFPKGGGNWSNRVAILDNGKVKWLTASVNRDYSGNRSINEIHFNERIDWAKQVRDAISNAYRKAPFFKQVSEQLFDKLSDTDSRLSNFNIKINELICVWLNIDHQKIEIASRLNVGLKSNERLIELTKLFGANTYMCGGGAQGYQQDELFQQAGIEILYQKFEPTPYSQFNSKEFIPGLSVIDAAMNLGIDQLAVFFNKSN